MKKILLLIILFGQTYCNSQELDGLWMLSNERVINSNKGYRTNSKGFIIDFDKSAFSHISTDSIIQVNIDSQKKEISFKGETEKLYINSYKNDSIEISLSENSISIFYPLDLNHQLSMTKKEVSEYFINHKFERIRDSLQLNFSSKKSKLELERKTKNMMTLKSRFLSNDEVIGNWYIGEKSSNYFLGLSLNPTNREYNIYQIISINNDKIKLKGLIEYDFLPDMTELKTSL